jgi:hypothetical protein
VTKQSCADFTGQLDLIEVTPQGGTRRIAGPLSGKLIDATSVRFDAFLEALPRQHLGSLSGDALEGTWLVLDGSGQSLSGTFGGQREK